MDEYERRKEAIRRVSAGESVSAVCRDLQRSRIWYYKWRKRYLNAGLPGLKVHRPVHEPPNKVPDDVRVLVQ
jgi:transposase-like protein